MCLQVNVVVQGRTAVHVAIEESHMEVLQVLLDFKPNLELEVRVCTLYILCMCDA